MSSTGRSVRRVGITLAVYGVAAALCWASIPGVRRMFLLPTLFVTVAKGGLILGGLIAVVVAWRYPRMGISPETD